MCTLILAWKVFDASPVFLASNRDERLDRPAVEPMVWDAEPPFVAPRDEQEGGTWLGVNARGVLVAITNRFGSERDATRRSRGELVVNTLSGHDAAEASAIAMAHPAPEFNPYHLLIADASRAFVTWSDGESGRGRELSPGVHVVTERSFDAAANGRAVFIEGVVGELRERDALTPAALTRLLAVHRPDDLDAISVLVPELNYGTRSSSVIDVAAGRFEFANGPPSEASYTDYSDLMRELS